MHAETLKEEIIQVKCRNNVPTQSIIVDLKVNFTRIKNGLFYFSVNIMGVFRIELLNMWGI